ncbi:MAG: phospholipase D-like domain-containing protein [Bacteroidia bacterium]|nr:phospholipase D-like domain-containing protein [Bacteroidia bacterium]
MNLQVIETACALVILGIYASGETHQPGVSPSFTNGPVISNLTYDSITPTGVVLLWQTDVPADSKLMWMASESNDQLTIFTDSIYLSAQATSHAVPINNLQPATIYKYQVTSQNTGGMARDSAYFVTKSLSTGNVEVYFNHTVNTSVGTGENAKGSQNFANLFINQINKAQHSIDVTLWGFSYYTSIYDALINAKNRGVKIRFIYNYTANAPLADSLRVHGIPVLKRDFDTTFSMHNKFLIFDYRYNANPEDKYLWTGSTNVSHPQFHSDKNNIIVIQDESLCAVYTREFEEMWGSHTDLPDPARARFGTQKTDNVPHILNVGGKRMEVYFSPSDSVSAFLTNLIQTRTTYSLFFSMLKLELPAMEDALHSVFTNGIQIRGVFDSTNSQLANSAYPRMKGLPVTNTWNPPADVFLDTVMGLIHHKYLIIDANSPGGNKITSTGSFNWETPADIGNDENSLTIFDARVNNLYYQEFYQRYLESGGTSILINNLSEEVQPGFLLNQNYPNPFNYQTTIKFTITKVSNVKLVVHDILGHEVQTRKYETQPPGMHELTFNGSSLPDGIYFYTIYTGDYSETRKMILKK